jgi:hypothetical protein
VRLHQRLKETDQQGVRDFLRECRLAAGYSGRGRNDLLADCGHHAIERAKLEAAAVRRRESHRQRKDLSTRRFEGDCD